MISAKEMLKKVGKRKFVEMATHCKVNGPTGYDKTRGIKGRVRFRMCIHGNWVIENYKPKKCSQCFDEVQTKPKDFIPYFNIGLGGWVESRSDERKSSKRLGLTEAG